MGQASLVEADMGFTCAYLFLDSKILSKSERWEEVPKYAPTFEIGIETWLAGELLIESFFKEKSNLRFHPSLRDFMDNSNVILTNF